MLPLSDPIAERGILAGICQYGTNAYYDISDIIKENSFTLEINRDIFRCLKYICEQRSVDTIDAATIYSTALTLSRAMSVDLHATNNTRHLNAIISLKIQFASLKTFAIKLRKLEVARLLHTKFGEAQHQIVDITGDESFANILAIAEDTVFDFTALLDSGEAAPSSIGTSLVDYLKYLGDNPVKQLGVSTGMPAYDKSIGGGLRPGTVNVIAARPKTGKTMLATNIGYYIAKQSKIPVLNMDTEMLLTDHQHRLVARTTGIDINIIETGMYAKTPYMKQKVLDAGKHLETVPYYHKSIAGTPFEEQLGIMRRWLSTTVGFNQDGTAKPCVIIYDYLKLMDTQGMSSDLKEYQLLGFMMTALHNFSVRYRIPFLVFMQLNRDGITKESTDTASGSDRIIWLCSNFTIFKLKSVEEIAEDGLEYGTRKLVPVVSRHGEGMAYGDYINCDFQGRCAKIVEGKTKNELLNRNSHEQTADTLF